MTVSMFVNNNLNNNSRLLELVCAQMPEKELLKRLAGSENEVQTKELLIGTQWLLSVQHAEVGDRTYDNISSYMRAPDGQQLEVWSQLAF